MTRYFFDILADDEIVPDEEGMNLPDLQAAVREATDCSRTSRGIRFDQKTSSVCPYRCAP